MDVSISLLGFIIQNSVFHCLTFGEVEDSVYLVACSIRRLGAGSALSLFPRYGDVHVFFSYFVFCFVLLIIQSLPCFGMRAVSVLFFF